MIVYALLLVSIASMALLYSWRDAGKQSQHIEKIAFYSSGGFIIFVFAGGSIALGCDWEAYQRFFDTTAHSTFIRAATGRDPGFFTLNWIANAIGGEIIGPRIIQVVIALIFTIGLVRFCAGMPRGQEALVAAIPYLVIVVATGFTRQAAALGFLMIALSIQGEQWRHIITKSLLLMLGISFHIPFLPIAAIIALSFKLRWWQWCILGLTGATAAFFIVDTSQFVHTFRFYLDGSYERSDHVFSVGAFYRVPLIAGGTILWLAMALRWPQSLRWPTALDPVRWPAITFLAIPGFFLIGLLPFLSTVSDRYGIYLSVVVLAAIGYSNHLPAVMGRVVRWGTYPTALLLLVGWLFFAQHAQCWVPYKSWLIPTALPIDRFDS